MSQVVIWSVIALTLAALGGVAFYVYTVNQRMPSANKSSKPKSKKKAAKEARKNRGQFSLE